MSHKPKRSLLGVIRAHIPCHSYRRELENRLEDPQSKEQWRKQSRQSNAWKNSLVGAVAPIHTSSMRHGKFHYSTLRGFNRHGSEVLLACLSANAVPWLSLRSLANGPSSGLGRKPPPDTIHGMHFRGEPLDLQWLEDLGVAPACHSSCVKIKQPQGWRQATWLVAQLSTAPFAHDLTTHPQGLQHLLL